MRLTRLCQKRKAGACHVDEPTHLEWKNGGERKEWLELALLETLKEVGVDAGPAAFKKTKVLTSIIFSMKGFQITMHYPMLIDRRDFCLDW